MKYEIKGGAFPVVELIMNSGDVIVSEAGAMAWRDPSITCESNVDGGIKQLFGRALSGETLMLNHYTASKDNSRIAFSSCVPGSIVAVEVKEGQPLICQKHAFLAAVGNVELSVHFNNRARVGLFAGEGFIMEKISGNGIVFLEIDGSVYDYDLVEGEKMIVSTGHLVSMSSTCSIDVEMINGAKNIFFGGEGFFNTVITGPGKVTVQTMPISKIGHAVNPYISHPESK